MRATLREKKILSDRMIQMQLDYATAEAERITLVELLLKIHLAWENDASAQLDEAMREAEDWLKERDLLLPE